MTGNDERKISSLRDLPLDIAPPRDLWQGIEARLAGQSAGHGAIRSEVESARRFGRAGRMRLIAAAAMIPRSSETASSPAALPADNFIDIGLSPLTL